MQKPAETLGQALLSEVPLPSLKDRYNAYFPIGTTGSVARFQQVLPLVAKHFNRVTAEYEMKWGALQPREGDFTFSSADLLIKTAEEQSMVVTGHTLIWHGDTPRWVYLDAKGEVASPAVLRDRMKTYIKTVMQHFKGHVDSWDVVNEALADDAPIYRNSDFFRLLGSEQYIADSFRWAAEADPNVELWYNDYNIESPAKLEKLMQLIRFLKTQKVKLTGIGFQAHTSLNWPTPALFEKAFQQVIAEGLKIKVSEIDMSIYNDYSTGIFQPEPARPCDRSLMDMQAQRYADLFKVFRKYKSHIAHITFWGVADDATWLDSVVKGRKDCPLLFDSNFQPKPAFHAIANFADS